MKSKIKNQKAFLIILSIAVFVFLPMFFVKAETCLNECFYYGQHSCIGSSGRTCGNYDSDSCFEFSSLQYCDNQCFYCGDDTCNSNCGENSDNCLIDCSKNNALPSISLVSSLNLWSGASTVLSAKASDPDGEPLTYHWSCDGGYLGDTEVLNLVYTAPDVNADETYHCTLTVNDYRGGSRTATVNIRVRQIVPVAEIIQTLRNVTKNQTSWQKNISVNPGDKVEFQINIKATEKALNIMVLEFLPSQVSYGGNLKVDGKAATGNIINGLEIGDLAKGKSKVITFEATVPQNDYFAQESTPLSVVAEARASYMLAATETSLINVVKTPIQLAANESQQETGTTTPTAVNTGITNTIIDSLLLPFFISLIVIFILKSKIISLDEWLDRRKEKVKKYLVLKTLKNKIKHIRTHEREIYQTWRG